MPAPASRARCRPVPGLRHRGRPRPRSACWAARALDDPGLPNVRLWPASPPTAAPRRPAPAGATASPSPWRSPPASPTPAAPDAILRRLGAASGLAGLRYWAASRGRWEDLFDEAPYAVADPDSRERRPDHAPADLAPGRDAYAYQDPAGPVGGAVYRTRVREAGPDRLVADSENATTARAGGLIPLRPGTIRLVHYFDRLPDGSGWAYYGLVGLATSPDTARTYVNRAAALFRHLAGLPPEREPPVWP
jgi:hypothetical protein